MIVLLTLLSVLATLLILPGWLWFRREHPQSVSLLILPIFGVGLWVVITSAGIGPQSLSNIVESFAVAATAVIMVYLKFLALDRSQALQSQGTTIAFLVVALVTLGLRLFMPLIPE